MKYPLNSYQTLVFDFDGVILDSDEFKIETFLSLFTAFPEALAEIDDYNRKNRSISRYVKFEYIFKNILKLPYDEQVEREIGERYGRLLAKSLTEMPLISGVKDFLAQQQVPLFIASTAVPEEIKNVVEAKSIGGFFTDIYAYPTSKAAALTDVIAKLRLQMDQVLFFGEAIADFATARDVGVDFIAVNKLPEIFPQGTRTIANFLELLA